MKTTIYASELRAAMEFTSKDESRPVLCGVYVRAGERTEVVATDSYRLVDMVTEEKPDEAGECILDLRSVKIPTKKGLRVCVWHEEGKPEARLVFPGQTMTVPVIEGNYPDFEKLLPSGLHKGHADDIIAEPVTRMTLNPDYVSKCGKALYMWAGTKNWPMPLEFRGETKPVYHESRDENRIFKAIIMPVRADKKRYLQQPASITGNASIDELERELKTTKKAHEELAKLYEKKCKEVDELKANPGEGEKKPLGYDKRLKELEAEVEHWKEEFAKQLEMNAKLAGDIEELEIRDDQMVEKIAELNDENESRASKVMQLEAELEALRKSETCEPVPQDDEDDDIEIIDEEIANFIAAYEAVELAGQTWRGYYLRGIQYDTEEYWKIKDMGGKWKRHHKEFPMTWFVSKK